MSTTDESRADSQGLSRREVLQRGGFVVGATALWATPLVQTVGLRPAAATGDAGDLCPDIGASSSGQPRGLVFEFQPRACADSNNDQNLSGGGRGGCDDSGPLPAETTGWKVVWTQTGGSGGSSDPITVGVGSELTRGTDHRPGAWARFVLTHPSHPGFSQDVEFHTSCSQPLSIGDTFGSFELIDFAEAGNRKSGDW